MRKNIRPVLLAILLSSISLPARAQTFPFELPWDDSAQSATSVGDLNPAPLTNAQRISVKDGHFVDATGRRVRFLGTNIVSSAAFTRPEEASSVAARLHKFGFNIVRMHHIDASWSNPSIFGADHDAGKGPNQKVDADSLELLDNFVAELKKQGVYTNLNLHVSRTLSPGDGFPDTDKLPELAKSPLTSSRNLSRNRKITRARFWITSTRTPDCAGPTIRRLPWSNSTTKTL